jgi:hypothetical protein
MNTKDRTYQPPAVVDYGTLVDLTAANFTHGFEDGLGKGHGQPESHPGHP